MNNKIFFSYSHEDVKHIKRLIEKLSELGIECDLLEDSISPGDSWENMIIDRISSAKIVVIFLTENSINSQSVLHEIAYSVSISKNRDKIILPIAQWGKQTLDSLPASLKYLLFRYQVVLLENGLNSNADYNKVSSIISDLLYNNSNKEQLYSQIAAFKKIGYTEKVAVKLSELIVMLYNQISEEHNFEKRIVIYQEICKCTIELNNGTGLTYGNDARKSAHSILEAVFSMQKMLREDDFRGNDLLIIAIAIIVINCMIRIWIDCIDTITSGDVHSPGIESLQNYTSQHEMYCMLYDQLVRGESILNQNYSADQVDIIISAKKHFNLFVGVSREKEQSDHGISEEEKKLWEIAEYIEKSNHIFDLIGDKNKEPQYLKCLQTSYERLMKFSEISGYKKICAVCIERIEKIKQELESYDLVSSSESLAENAIRALLGLTVFGDTYYDVFISYKHEDLDIAQNVFHFLQSNLLYPFLDKTTLPQIAESEYENAIMNALDNSKHFIAIISKLEDLQSHWIKLEMDTFHHEIIEGRKSGSNFIILVTDDVYDEIIRTKATPHSCKKRKKVI